MPNDPYWNFKKKKSQWLNVAKADNPVALWLLDDSGSGTALNRVNDSLYPLTVAGGVTRGLPGPFLGGSASYLGDGTGYYNAAYNAALHPGNTVSYELWIKRTRSAVAEDILFQGTGDAEIYFSSGDKVVFGKSGSTALFTSTASVTDTNWHQYVFTKTGTTTAAYQDGAAMAGSGVDTTLVASAVTPTWIASETGPAFMLAGNVAAVAIYNTALADTQIAAHYNAGISAA